VPIRTDEQRQALESAKAFISKNQSLIPEGKTYIKQRHLYDRETRGIELKNCHGLRHVYAQTRYKESKCWATLEVPEQVNAMIERFLIFHNKPKSDEKL
jgi:hypothetical protein